MSIQIKQKIVDYDIVNAAAAAQQVGEGASAGYAEGEAAASNVVQMHEKLERMDTLSGCTYKIKNPVSEHAFYITINNYIFMEGTPSEKILPFEIFINSKNMDHYQWVSALTLIISAVFRKGGDVTFLVKELQSVFDPKGGYFRKGGKFMPSLVAEIGTIIEMHLQTIGLLAPPSLDEHQQQFVQRAREQYTQRHTAQPDDAAAGDFPPGAQLCGKCNTVAMVVMDNCLTCLNCGESKCG